MDRLSTLAYEALVGLSLSLSLKIVFAQLLQLPNGAHVQAMAGT